MATTPTPDASPPDARPQKDASAAGERPARGAARRRAILDAARDLFLQHGYDGVPMHEVVARAGGSLATIYRLFGSKEGLFEAILDEVSSEIVAPLLDEELEKQPLEAALQRLGETFLERIVRPDALAWHRVCLAEGTQHAGLRAALFRSGPGRVRELLAAFLGRQTRAGRLRIADPLLAASQFLALVKAGVHSEMICGEPISLSPDGMHAQVASAVDLFLRGYAIHA